MKSIAKDKPSILTLRVPKSLHKEISEAAGKEGITLNTYCIYILSKGRTWHNPEQKPCQSLRKTQKRTQRRLKV